MEQGQAACRKGNPQGMREALERQCFPKLSQPCAAQVQAAFHSIQPANPDILHHNRGKKLRFFSQGERLPNLRGRSVHRLHANISEAAAHFRKALALVFHFQGRSAAHAGTHQKGA